MDLIRRTVLGGAAAGGVLAGLLAADVLKPTLAYASAGASARNNAAFDAREFGVALKAIGGEGAAAHTELILRAPELAENGAVVPVDVTSNIPNTTSIAVLVRENPRPLSALIEFSGGAQSDVSLRLKFSRASVVQAIARADGKIYTVHREVRVGAGGC